MNSGTSDPLRNHPPGTSHLLKSALLNDNIAERTQNSLSNSCVPQKLVTIGNHINAGSLVFAEPINYISRAEQFSLVNQTNKGESDAKVENREDVIEIKYEPLLDDDEDDMPSQEETEIIIPNTTISCGKNQHVKKITKTAPPKGEVVNQVQIIFIPSDKDSPKERLLKRQLQELAEIDLLKSKRIRLLQNLVWRQKKEIEQLKQKNNNIS
ncbi:uncharacterized protein LOC132696974 [Cylas formicarius]|uniref:uncharacterized protein LOC132696974 n=1 Tax=Cylas formicarius TaxID=197179 RepID=UPI002958A710|nr:uncharacterized protein LOC132696974 [Cylas formicarius]